MKISVFIYLSYFLSFFPYVCRKLSYLSSLLHSRISVFICSIISSLIVYIMILHEILFTKFPFQL